MTTNRIEFVYFIQSSQGGNIKIGFSCQPMTRLEALRLSNENTALNFIGLMEGGKEVETKIHKMFNPLRMNGEWFTPDKSLIEFIDTNAKSIPFPKDKTNDRGMCKIAISIPDEMLKQVDEVGKDGLFAGVGRSELIRRAIEDWLIKQWQKRQQVKTSE